MSLLQALDAVPGHTCELISRMNEAAVAGMVGIVPPAARRRPRAPRRTQPAPQAPEPLTAGGLSFRITTESRLHGARVGRDGGRERRLREARAVGGA